MSDDVFSMKLPRKKKQFHIFPEKLSNEDVSRLKSQVRGNERMNERTSVNSKPVKSPMLRALLKVDFAN